MRSEVSLDADVVKAVRQFMTSSDVGFDVALNQLARAGAELEHRASRTPFVQSTVSLRDMGDVSNVAEALEIA